MTFQPVVLSGGYAGWKLLTRTLESQQAAHDGDPQIKREEAYFREKIGQVKTADDLVNDRTLLKVALGAFGLEDDLQNKFFIKKVLEGGVLDAKSLANKLSDPRYASLSKTFGFGDYSVPRTVLSDFPDEILTSYRRQSFEKSVGEVDPDLRLALSLERELQTIQKKTQSPNAQWFSVMGSAPLRSVFQTALGLPDSFSAIDLDQQLGIFREKASQQFGVSEVKDFVSGQTLDDLRRNFLLRSSATATDSGTSSGSAALRLLSGGQSGSSGILGALYGF